MKNIKEIKQICWFILHFFFFKIYFLENENIFCHKFMLVLFFEDTLII